MSLSRISYVSSSLSIVPLVIEFLKFVERLWVDVAQQVVGSGTQFTDCPSWRTEVAVQRLLGLELSEVGGGPQHRLIHCQIYETSDAERTLCVGSERIGGRSGVGLCVQLGMQVFDGLDEGHVFPDL